MKRILVPTDFSEASLSALKVASEIAKKRSGISIRLSHVYFVPRVPSVTNEDFGFDVRKQKEIVDDLHQKFQELAKRDFVKGIKIETQIIPHLNVLDLLNHKDNKSADLIICGVHGDKDWHRTIEASHTETIIRNANCPVLCVHEKLIEPFQFHKVVFASDFSPEIENVFPKLKKIFDVLGCQVNLVKVITPSRFDTTLHTEQLMKDFAKKLFLTNYTVKVFNDENVELGIHQYANSLGAHIIAMETHGHTGFTSYLKGSILESVAHHSDLPVLSVKLKP